MHRITNDQWLNDVVSGDSCVTATRHGQRWQGSTSSLWFTKSHTGRDSVGVHVDEFVQILYCGGMRAQVPKIGVPILSWHRKHPLVVHGSRFIIARPIEHSKTHNSHNWQKRTKMTILISRSAERIITGIEDLNIIWHLQVHWGWSPRSDFSVASESVPIQGKDSHRLILRAKYMVMSKRRLHLESQNWSKVHFHQKRLVAACTAHALLLVVDGETERGLYPYAPSLSVRIMLKLSSESERGLYPYGLFSLFF